ncbi:Tubulin-tyrosine ligase family protein [Dictyocaulus viviparus]|uniref:Tubulin--tyrosine ligase-like protein 5 n=1 Tax=Dictyocaulus viviparus TaxID=29172 RepID=A0A0D8XBW4_DICVI|nr:Tubulin-tyrosine ligase family protein [Dictyocaulus viviparus]
MKPEIIRGEENCCEETSSVEHIFISDDSDAFYSTAGSRKKVEYLTFTPDSLNHISKCAAADAREKQRLNQFPRSTELTRKDKLYDNIRRSASIFGNAFNFIPEYFVTPRDCSLLSMNHSTTDHPFIVKPVSSSRGQGIFFANELREIPLTDKLLVSRYVKNPLLINGHKFDLRIYVAVTSFYPLIAYIYSEGITRVASEKYCNEIESRNVFVHLTNYSINKNNSKFIRNESMTSEDFGHKWTLGALLRHLEKDGIDSKCKLEKINMLVTQVVLMLRIEDIVVKSLLSVQARITSACRTTTRFIGTNFELFGFDILVDAELKPWLLEVNLSPSLSCDAPVDSLVKTRLICDLFNLACVPLINRKVIGIESVDTCKENEYESIKSDMFSDAGKKLLSPTKRCFVTKVRMQKFKSMENYQHRVVAQKERLLRHWNGNLWTFDGNLTFNTAVEHHNCSTTVSRTKLPIVRPSARLRTRSCSEWYEVKKATLAEAKMKLRTQQKITWNEYLDRPENKENSSPSFMPIS